MAAWKKVTLATLEMRNFKRFYGVHLIDLAPSGSAHKPLILIGGNNGSGKTSIHEAINYALYEREDLPGITTKPNYIKAVSDRLNRRALDEGQQEYGVALDLVASDGTAERQFRIERNWRVNLHKRTVEDWELQILEAGRPIDWVRDESQLALQDFIGSILPPRIAQFFFFDGERIQEFADDMHDQHGMVDAIEDILSINIYKQLRKDLKTYVVDYVEAQEIKNIEPQDFFKLQEDLERIKSQLEAKADDKLDLERELEDLGAQQKRINDELRRIGGIHAAQREDLIADRERIEGELNDAKRDLERAFEPLPILLAGSLCNDLRQTLVDEQASAHTTPEALEELKRKLLEIERRVFIAPEPPPAEGIRLSEDQLHFYLQVFGEVAADVLGLKLAQMAKLRLHDIGDGQRQEILRRLDEAAQTARGLREVVNRRERLVSELRDIQTKLQSTSDSADITSHLEKKQGIDHRIGRLGEELKSTIAEIQRLEADKATRSRQIEDRQRARAATSEAKRVVKLAQEARRVLDSFIQRLAPEKLRQLREHFSEMYWKLRKSEDPVHDVAIDKETWQVILKDDKGRPLEKRVFSAGMKEMYALSLLWGLARASGRELPMVIDTPVGRLDTTNRRRLFEVYLPGAGHQVIVLSTDTELDVQWAERLAGYVSKQYRLDYDRSNDSTVVRPGYFF